MSMFKRGLQPLALTSLRRLAEGPGQNWWKDLLKMWVPSGSIAGTHGLRLAIRNNYLNFYSRGQSVARVGFTSACAPYVDTHVKYAFDGEKTQAHARLEGTTIRRRKTGEHLTYNGAATLHEWIARATEHSGIEKRCVDQLVADNPLVIDLEMALPAEGDRKTAQRMDCVVLEQAQDVIRIVFWEAKMIDEPRLRSTTDPKVIGQVKVYREYLQASAHARSVEDAYRNTCGLLEEIRKMAEYIGTKISLDPLISVVVQNATQLKVDPTPRLVIFGGVEYQKKRNWPDHEARLSSSGIPLLVFENKPYTLRHPETNI